VSEARRLTVLEDENARLKRMLTKMTSVSVLIECHDHVALITLDRPDRRDQTAATARPICSRTLRPASIFAPIWKNPWIIPEYL